MTASRILPVVAGLLVSACAPGALQSAPVVDTAWVEDAVPDDGVAPESAPLEVRFLGVGGVSLRHGDDHVMTAPLYSNPGMFDVTLGSVRARTDVIDTFLPDAWVDGTQAILVGHAHYDHLLDVPYVQHRSGGPTGATVFGNVSTRNLVGGVVPADRIVAVNDALDPRVDMRMCSEPDPCTGIPSGTEGAWIEVPGSNARVRALCSMHPAQVLGVIHFGEGCVDAPLDAPPTKADDWLEGATLAWLVDFLDADGAPVHRVYYQDAPSDGPMGHVHPELLAEKRVDLAILNVGNYDVVPNHPGEILGALEPRYVLGAHWEDFFRTQHQPIRPIPLHVSPVGFDAGVAAGLDAAPELEAVVNGVPDASRYWRPLPGTRIELPAE